MMPLRTILLPLLLALVLGLGCGKRKRDKFPLPGQTSYVVEQLTIRGVTKFNVAELKSGLATRKSSWTAKKGVKWIPVLGGDRKFFNYVHWQQDLERIRTYYYARGYFDAKVVSENIVEDPLGKTVRIAITVSEGSPTKVSEVELEGARELVGEQSRWLSSVAVRKGRIFTELDYLESRKSLQHALEAAGYAYAQVTGRVVIDARQHEAQVVFYVDSGPMSEFGDIVIEGTTQVPVSAIRDAVTFQSGQRFSSAKMQETQERIYDLGVFSVVKVVAETSLEVEEEEVEPAVPAEESEEVEEFSLDGLGELLDEAQENAAERAELDPRVAVTIRVKEAKLWNVRVGAGLAAEVARQDIHGRVDWSSRNFLGGLRKLEQFNSVGYAWAPSIFRDRSQRDQGVLVDSELRFTQPQFIERFTKLETRLRFQRQVEQGFNLLSPTAKIGVRRKFFRWFSAEVSYNFALFLLTELDSALLDPSLQLQPEYVLEYFEQRLSFDIRNDFFNPTRGLLVELQLQEAGEYVGKIPGNPIGGNFTYLAPTLAIEGYIPIWYGVLAARARAATIYNLSDKLPPIPQRISGGGADSMRAFGRQRLSLYSVSGDAIAIGGFTKVEASLEPRFRLVRNMADVGDFWVAPFLDAASVLPGSLGAVLDNDAAGPPPEALGGIWDTLLYGVGLGAWWVTPIGPVRLDVAYRLSDVSDDPRFRRCAVEPNYAGTCNGEFIPVASDPVLENVYSPWNVILGIGHSF